MTWFEPLITREQDRVLYFPFGFLGDAVVLPNEKFASRVMVDVRRANLLLILALSTTVPAVGAHVHFDFLTTLVAAAVPTATYLLWFVKKHYRWLGTFEVVPVRLFKTQADAMSTFGLAVRVMFGTMFVTASAWLMQLGQLAFGLFGLVFFGAATALNWAIAIRKVID